MSKTILMVLGVVVLLAAVGGGAFYTGMQYGASQERASISNLVRQRGAGGAASGAGGVGGTPGALEAAAGPCGFQRAAGANPIQSGRQGQGQGNPQQFGQCVALGQIKAIDGETIQISTPVNVVTIKVNAKTLISKTDVGALADLKVGERVMVFSQETSDTPMASAIQIQRAPNPQ